MQVFRVFAKNVSQVFARGKWSDYQLETRFQLLPKLWWKIVEKLEQFNEGIRQIEDNQGNLYGIFYAYIVRSLAGIYKAMTTL